MNIKKLSIVLMSAAWLAAPLFAQDFENAPRKTKTDRAAWARNESKKYAVAYEKGEENLIDFSSSKKFGTLSANWRTRCLPGKWQTTLAVTNTNDEIYSIMGLPNPKQKRMLISDTLSMVRFCGGDKVLTEGDAIDQWDLAVKKDGKIVYNWDLMDKKLSTVLDNGMTPLIVLDNIPYAFAEGKEINSHYGQNKKPNDWNEWAKFVNALCLRLKEKCGDAPNNWRFRVGTEPDNENHWESGAADSFESFMTYYDVSVNEVKKVFPNAKVGPGNFNAPSAGFDRLIEIDAVVKHCAEGTNYATGKKGSPLDFLGISRYAVSTMKRDSECFSFRDDLLRLSIGLLRDAVNKYPQFKDIPLELQEHGLLVLDGREGISDPTTGAHAAAWWAMEYIVGTSLGTAQFFHWQDYDTVAGKTIPNALVWNRAQLEKLIGSKKEMPKIIESNDAYEFHAMGFDSKDKFTVMASLYDPKRDSNDEETVKIKIPYGIVSKESVKANAINMFSMNEDKAISDFIYRETEGASGSGDVFQPASPKGKVKPAMKKNNLWKQWAAKNIDKVLAKEKELYSSVPFDGKIEYEKDASVITIKMKKPSVIFLNIKK